MNPRIRELALQAGFQYISDEGIGWAGNYNASLPKFAELIVRDSCRILKLAKTEPFPFDEDYACRLLKQHFGMQ